MQIAVLALQGAFIEHEHMLSALGVDSFEIRQLRDIQRPFDGLIIPGGESTVQGKLLRELGLFEPIRQAISAGLPVFGTCAGLILLAQRIDEVNGDGSVVDEQHNSTWLATLPVTVRRNAYGRQLGSFHTVAPFERLGEVPMTFIRAPFITQVDSEVQVLSVVNDNIVAVRYGNQLGVSFHPELDESLEIHRMFLSF